MDREGIPLDPTAGSEVSERDPARQGGEGPRIVEVTDETQLPTCLAVIRRAFSTVARDFGCTEQTAPTNAAFWTPDRLLHAIRNGSRLFALLIAGVPVGTMSLRPARQPGSLELERLAVLPEYRHHGHGRTLMDYAFEVARQEGATAVTIGIIAENRRLGDWYRAYGFTPTGTHTFDHLPFTVLFMQRPVLPTPPWTVRDFTRRHATGGPTTPQQPPLATTDIDHGRGRAAAHKMAALIAA